MATHSSILAWEIPWTEDPGGLQPTGSHRGRRDLATKQQQQQGTGESHIYLESTADKESRLPARGVRQTEIKEILRVQV